MHDKPTLEKSQYDNFCRMFFGGQFPHLRFGQAFHQHFKLEKMTPSVVLDKLYQMDGAEARRMIHHLFDFQ